MAILFLVSSVLACAVLYLSHRHQGWLNQPLSKPWRAAGLLLLALGLACALRSFSTSAAVFAWLAVLMLTFSLLPFLSLLIKKSRHEQQS